MISSDLNKYFVTHYHTDETRYMACSISNRLIDWYVTVACPLGRIVEESVIYCSN